MKRRDRYPEHAPFAASSTLAAGTRNRASGPYSDYAVEICEGRTDCRNPASFPVALYCGDGLQILERAGEGIGQAPHGPWLELLMHGLKVQVMHSPCQVLGKARFLLDEGLVDEQLGRSRRTTAATAKPPPAASAARSSFASGPHQ